MLRPWLASSIVSSKGSVAAVNRPGALVTFRCYDCELFLANCRFWSPAPIAPMSSL